MATQEQTISETSNESRDLWRFINRGGSWVLLAFSIIGFMSAFGSGFGFYAAWVLWLASYFVAVLVHELGHAFAAILCGWRVVVFAAGPLGWQTHNGNVTLIPRAQRTEAEGFVLSAPTSAELWTRARYATIIAGGPVASLILTAIAAAAAVHWASPVEHGLDWSAFAGGFAFAAAATAFSTLTPDGRRGRETDIENLLRTLRTDDRKWCRHRALGWLFALTKYKLRLRDLPLWMLADAQNETAAAGGDFERAYDSLVIGIVLDSPPVDTLRTRELLDDFRAKYGASAWFDSCDAYFTAVWEGDGERARQRLWRGDAEDAMKPMLYAADAAVKARLGEAQMARASLRRMREAIRKNSAFADPTFRDIERQIEALLPTGRP